LFPPPISLSGYIFGPIAGKVKLEKVVPPLKLILPEDEPNPHSLRATTGASSPLSAMPISEKPGVVPPIFQIEKSAPESKLACEREYSGFDIFPGISTKPKPLIQPTLWPEAEPKLEGEETEFRTAGELVAVKRE
jgi:hypothetical protein